MKKYVKNIVDNLCIEVYSGTDKTFALKRGFELKNVELGYDGNYYIKGFCPQQPLEELKQIKKAEINQAKEKMEFSDFTFGSVTIDADEKSQSNIQAKILEISLTNAEEVEWVTADNQIIKMPTSDFITMSMALAKRNQEVVFKGRVLKDKLLRANTKDEIESIKWEE